MTQLEQDLYFALLRISLWNKEDEKHELNRFFARCLFNFDNVSILKSFDEHALLGMVADTVLSFSDQLRFKAIQKDYILQYVANSYQLHYSTQQAIVEVFQKLEEAGCKPILLKGEGLAQIYPTQCLRANGDVDAYVDKEDFGKAVACMNSLCEAKAVQHAKLGNHDYSIRYKGIPFEIHFTPGYASIEEAEDRFQELANEWLVPERCQSIMILGKQVLIPPSQYNILYVFDHLARHYRNSELGIRQFIDWALLLKKTTFQESILKAHLEELQILDAWRRLAGVLHVALGMENIPFYDAGDTKRSEKIIQVVMSRGNFAQQLTELEAKGGLYYLLSLFKRSREIGLVFPAYSRKWLSIQLKRSLKSYFKNTLQIKQIKRIFSSTR